jgi:hypothetical protein
MIEARPTGIPKWARLALLGGLPLFVLRVCLEWTSFHWLLVWGVAALALAIAFLLHIALLPTESLGFLWVYVVWPLCSPALAASAAFVGVVGTVIAVIEDKARPTAPFVVDGLVFAAGLILYVATLAPTILPADSGEFQIVGPLLGVAHPPGYALFTMFAKMFSLTPLGEVAWRVNLMGAVTGALTLAVVNCAARQMTGSRWAGIAAAGVLGFSTTFWAQSTTANIRALIALFTSLCILALIKFTQSPPNSRSGSRALTALSLFFGLLTSHHYPQAAFAPLFLAVVLWHDPALIRRVRAWPRYLGAFIVPFAANLYIVVRAATGAPFGTQDLTSAGRIIDHLLGKGFRGDMFAFLRLDRVLWERLLVVGNILVFQFGFVLLSMATLGMAWLAWLRRKQALLLGGMLAIMAFIVATYRAPQSVEYMLPAYIPIALCAGEVIGAVTQSVATTARRPRSAATAQALFASALLLPIAALGYRHLPSYLELHRDRSAREYAEGVLLQAPPEAHILSNWHWYTPLRYLQLVEGQRLDVQVSYIYPQGDTPMPYAWPQRIERELQLSNRPLIVTNYYPTFADLPYRFRPLGQAYLVQTEPSWQLPDTETQLDLDFGNRIRLAGYTLQQPSDLHPGDWITVDLVWQPVARLDKPYSFSVQLIGPDGIPLGQQDRRHDAARSYRVGEVLVDRYRFPVYTTAAPGNHTLTASIYFTQEGGGWERLALPSGSDVAQLQTLVVSPGQRQPITTRTMYAPFAKGPVLVGVAYDDTMPNQRRVYLHWRVGDRPVSAELSAASGWTARRTVPGSDVGGYVTTAIDAPPGTKQLGLTCYDLDTGLSLPRRGPWGMLKQQALGLPPIGDSEYYLPLGGKMALVGVRTDRVWRPGTPQRVALRFQSLTPIVHDYVVSVAVQGQNVAPPPSDSVPALGAIPTFKWIRGSRVNDVHLIDIPPEASGHAQLTCGVYDAFTMLALPPLDERVARLGLAGVPLGTVTIP